MKKLTKKYIFKQKLKGVPIFIRANKITNNEIRCLLDCGVIKQFAKSPRKISMLNLVLGKYPIINVIPKKHPVTGKLSEEYDHIVPTTKTFRSVVRLRTNCK